MTDGRDLIVAAINAAEEVQDAVISMAQNSKPRLLVKSSDPDRTVSALRDILSDAGVFYDRGLPVRLAYDLTQGGAVAQVMTPPLLVLIAHKVCRPYSLKKGRQPRGDCGW